MRALAPVTSPLARARTRACHARRAHGAEEIGAAASGRNVLGINSGTCRFLDGPRRDSAGPRFRRPGPAAESGIGDSGDVRRLKSAGYEAFLVGEALLRAENPEEALRDLQA